MRTKIITGAVISVIVATSLYAAGTYCDNSNNGSRYGMNNQGMQGQHMQGYNMQGQHMQGYNMQGQHMQGHQGYKNQKNSGFRMHGMLQTLNLTSLQQTKIDNIIKEHKNSKTFMSSAFTKTGFDKTKFIKFATEKRDNMIKSRADMIEAIYTILSDEQKLQFKVLLDLKMNHMSKRFNSDQRSNGRG